MCEDPPSRAYADVCQCLLEYLRLLGQSPRQDVVKAVELWTKSILAIEKNMGIPREGEGEGE